MCLCVGGGRGGGGGKVGRGTYFRKYIIAHTEQESVPNQLLTFTALKLGKKKAFFLI